MAAGININMAVVANVSDAVRGLNRATDSVKKLDQAVKPANDNLSRLERLLQGKGGGNRFFRSGLQQTGYQVGDFAVQVANGTSAMQAFGQQAPQLLQIFGPIGAIVGAAVSVFAAVAVVFEKTGDASKKAKAGIDPLVEATDKINQSAMALAETYNVNVPESLNAAREKFGELTAEVVKLLETQRKLKQEKLFADIAEQAELIKVNTPKVKEFLEIQRRINEIRARNVDNKQIRRPDYQAMVIAPAKQELKILNAQLDKLKGARGVADAIKNVSSALKAGNLDSAAEAINNLTDKLGELDDVTLDQRVKLTNLAQALLIAKKSMGEFGGKSDEAASSTGRLTKAAKDLLAQREPLDTTKGTLEPLIRQFDIQEKINQLLREGVSYEEAKKIAATGVGTELERARAAVEAALDAARAITAELIKQEDMGRIRTGKVPVPQARPESRPFLAEITKVQQQIDAARLSMDLINTGGFSPELAKQAAELKVQVGLTGEQMSVLIPKLQELEQLKTPVQSLQEAFRELADTVLDKVSNAFANAFTGIVNGTKSVSQAFKEMVGSILADFARMMAQKAAASLLGSLFGSLFGGGGGGYTGNVFGAPVPGFTQPLALGGVLSGGNIMPFARGGVVNRPTLFPMAKGAGLMGEAGPEAIMPLTRGPDGKLGVAGGGANVNVNIINQAGADVETKQNGPDIDVIIRRAVTSDIANGGQIYRAIGQRFETSTRLTRR